MSNKKQVQDKMKEEQIQLIESARKLMLASFGLAGMAQDQLTGAMGNLGNVQDELMRFFGDLVERGEAVENVNRKRVNDFVGDFRSQAKETATSVETDLNQQMSDLVTRLNVPTKDEFATLTRKLDNLNRKLNKMQKEQMEALKGIKSK